MRRQGRGEKPEKDEEPEQLPAIEQLYQVNLWKKVNTGSCNLVQEDEQNNASAQDQKRDPKMAVSENLPDHVISQTQAESQLVPARH